jgi:hypothetical protein
VHCSEAFYESICFVNDLKAIGVAVSSLKTCVISKRRKPENVMKLRKILFQLDLVTIFEARISS